MADSITVRISGSDIGLLAEKLTDNVINLCEYELDRVADKVKSDAKDNCPVDTGDLRNDIEVYVYKLKREIGNKNIPYAVYVHQGTVKMKARPYLLNAAETNNPAFIANMRNIKLSI